MAKVHFRFLGREESRLKRYVYLRMRSGMDLCTWHAMPAGMPNIPTSTNPPSGISKFPIYQNESILDQSSILCQLLDT